MIQFSSLPGPAFPSLHYLFDNPTPLNNTPEEGKPVIVLTVQRKRVSYPLDALLYVRAEHVYCRFYFADGQEVLQRTSLQRVIERIPSADFVRVHRSYLINLNYVTGFTSKQVFIVNNEIPIGRSYRPGAIDHLRARTSEK